MWEMGEENKRQIDFDGCGTRAERGIDGKPVHGRTRSGKAETPIRKMIRRNRERGCVSDLVCNENLVVNGAG